MGACVHGDLNGGNYVRCHGAAFLTAPKAFGTIVL